MVTRLLGASGLDLGPQEDLVGPGPDNPDGFFENPRFVAISDAVLEAFDGAWDVPPRFPPGWEAEDRLAELRRRAKALADAFRERARWGWKDPRCSLTLPFWRVILPDVSVVVCLRHPSEVYRSLERRGYASRRFALSLWRAYNESLVAAVPPERRVVTHYDAYFARPEAELRRVLQRLGLDAPDRTIARAVRDVSASRRHHRTPEAGISEAPLPAPVAELYRSLSEEAGMPPSAARA